MLNKNHSKHLFESICASYRTSKSTAIGCDLDNIDYKDQLKIKQTYLNTLFDRECAFERASQILAYRNKMEYSFGDITKGGELNLGLHPPKRHHDVVSVHNSYIVNDDFNVIVRSVEDYFRRLGAKKYDPLSKEGLLRHLVIRRSNYYKEILIGISTSSLPFDTKQFCDMLLGLNLGGKIVGILHLINDSRSNSVRQSDQDQLLYGRDFLVERILDFDFEVPFFSFLQAHTPMAEVLYSKMIDIISLQKPSCVLDLFCGIGTTSIFASCACDNVIGIEKVKDSVIAARKNAKLNSKNIEFICDDVFCVLNNLDITQDLVLLDPPRSGLGKKATSKIAESNVKSIVYISCNPKTLLEDCCDFEESGYTLSSVEGIDMYPFTKHLECIAFLHK